MEDVKIIYITGQIIALKPENSTCVILKGIYETDQKKGALISGLTCSQRKYPIYGSLINKKLLISEIIENDVKEYNLVCVGNNKYAGKVFLHLDSANSYYPTANPIFIGNVKLNVKISAPMKNEKEEIINFIKKYS